MTIETLSSGATLISFAAPPLEERRIAYAQNFVVEWIDRPDQAVTVESGEEMILLLSRGSARITTGGGDTTIDGATFAIIPAGAATVTLTTGGPLLLLATSRIDLTTAVDCRSRDERIAPIGNVFARRQPLDGVQVIPFDAIPNPSGNARIRFVQSATMSINIVRYDGPRDTTTLSPHAHKDIQQGTLAIAGHYIHHLRTAWGKNLAEWCDDEHVEAGPGTLLLIPPELVHTTQGVGEGEHLLIDIFAPPRRDFIGKGWVANASDYHDPEFAPHDTSK